MKTLTVLLHHALLAGIITAVLCVGMAYGLTPMKPFISIDNMNDTTVGTPVTITGMTSLPENSELVLELYPVVFETKNGVTSGEFTGVSDIITVKKGVEGINSWSSFIETENMPPGKYKVVVSTEQKEKSEIAQTWEDINTTGLLILH